MKSALQLILSRGSTLSNWKNLLVWWILEVSWKLLPFPFLFPHNSFGYTLEKALNTTRKDVTGGQQTIKKKTEDREKAYFTHVSSRFLIKVFTFFKMLLASTSGDSIRFETGGNATSKFCESKSKKYLRTHWIANTYTV